MGARAVIPAWVAPSARAVADCRGIAHAGAANTDRRVYAEVSATLAWVLDDRPTEEQAYRRMLDHTAEPIGDTLAWLLGMASRPPLLLPRRNPDGTLLSEEQLYEEYMRDKWGEPEERNEARRKARKDAIVYASLAALTSR